MYVTMNIVVFQSKAEYVFQKRTHSVETYANYCLFLEKVPPQAIVAELTKTFGLLRFINLIVFNLHTVNSVVSFFDLPLENLGL